MLGRAVRPNLRHGMDRDIYQIVRKLEDDGRIGGDGDARRLTVTSVYESIKRSNSSLARQKKRPLEGSIERVLALRKEETRVGADSNSDSDSDAALEAAEAKTVDSALDRDASLLNRQIAKAWGFASAAAKDANGARAADDGARTATNGSRTPGTPMDAGREPNGEPKPKKRKGERSREAAIVDRSPSTGVSMQDVAGLDDTLERLLDAVWSPLCDGSAYERLGYRFDCGVLLHGPSGCGKTMLAHALATSAGKAFIPVSAPSLVGGTSGESEKNIRDVFDEAIQLAPALVFFDEIDSIAGRRDSALKGMEGRMVAEMIGGMDRIKTGVPPGKNVVVLAATNRPEALDPAVRRRFNVEIEMGMPNQDAREAILRSMSRGLALAEDIDFRALAKMTPGYVGSDLQHVVTAAVAESIRGRRNALLARAQQKSSAALGDGNDGGDGSDGNAYPHVRGAQRKWLLLESCRDDAEGDIRLTFEHFRAAVARVQPASKREGFSTIPDTTWADVGALGDVRKKLEMSIIGPIKEPELFGQVGIKPAAGILLWGPPGCGKTLVAKAVANESKANFISIKGPELLNKYVGESERAVRQLFARARGSAPCILFFDELDALVPRRDDALSDASARVVNTLLTELDGVGDRSGIYVIGATNRPDVIDEAIRRPGRLGTSIYVGLPSAEDRVDILRTLYRNAIASKTAPVLSSTTTTPATTTSPQPSQVVAPDLEAVARDLRCTGFSGADLGSLMQAAAQACLERTYLRRIHHAGKEDENAAKDMSDGNPAITREDWEKALNEVKPSVKDIDRYLPPDYK